ncbi:MAG: nucleoid-associated protein [Bacteroidales bacterium]|nr:nucleoid-associated protein [Bacteroidales bacterium]
MPYFDSDAIKAMTIHHVGNKDTEEGLILSDKKIMLDERLQELLIQYFVAPFKAEEYYTFYHDENLELNELYGIARDIFADPEQFVEDSQRIARKLYDSCTHPNIKSGDLMVVYFDRCSLNGEEMDAIGIFKAENKDSFLKVKRDEEEWSRQEGDMSATADFAMEVHQGINIHKLDKGAIIFNSEKENGYILSIVDATNRGQDAVYWKDAFLEVRQREDEYYNTHAELSAYKQFVTDTLPKEFGNVEKADRADLLNRSVNYFKQNDSFDLQTFAEEVIQQPEVIESFKTFREEYQKENEVVLQDQFDINEEAVKKQARSFKSVIKLDKNFHIYVHGNGNLIEKGRDEKGKFYKVYYEEEN